MTVTQEMIEAGQTALSDHTDKYMDGSEIVQGGAVEAIYVAMSALAPTAPVEASGSEQLWSVGSWLSAALDDPKVCDAMKSDIRDWFDNGGHLRTTPARAEAQDEGAAGERGKSRGQVAYEGWAQGLPGCEWANQTRTQQRAWEKAAQAVIDAHPSPTASKDEKADWPWIKPEYKAADEARIKWLRDVDANDHMGAFASAIDAALALHAHPSPTPAADADRVLQDLADRVTAEVKRGADASFVQALGALSNIEAMVLAALKSTAAKEGGE